jgi:hypothetical protein
MAFVILLVLTGLLFVAEDDLADGHGGERGAPRAVRRVVPRRVLANIAPRSARDVGVVAEVVGLPAYVWFLEKARTVPCRGMAVLSSCRRVLRCVAV